MQAAVDHHDLFHRPALADEPCLSALQGLTVCQYRLPVPQPELQTTVRKN